MIQIHSHQIDDNNENLHYLKLVDIDDSQQVRALDISIETTDLGQWLLDNRQSLAAQLAAQPVNETLTAIYQARLAQDDLRNLPAWLRDPAAVDAYIDANVTSLATAREALKRMARAIIWLARRQ
jgi:hypothetical protein